MLPAVTGNRLRYGNRNKTSAGYRVTPNLAPPAETRSFVCRGTSPPATPQLWSKLANSNFIIIVWLLRGGKKKKKMQKERRNKKKEEKTRPLSYEPSRLTPKL